MKAKAMTLKLKEGQVVKGIKEFDDSKSYEFLRDSVHGYIEHIYLPELDEIGIDCWGNEEAKLLGMEPTLPLIMGDEIYDVACGPLVFTRSDLEGNTIGLNDMDFEIISNYLQNTFNKYLLINLVGGSDE